MSYQLSGVYDALTSSEASDVETVRQWSTNVTDNGWAPSRMPNAKTDSLGDSGHVGELAARATGPGTVNASIPAPYVFYLAPDAVRKADARIADGLKASRSGPLLNVMQTLGMVPPGTAIDPVTGQPIAGGGLGDLTDVAKWAAFAVGGLLLVNVLGTLKRNSHGQPISRY